MGHHGQGSFIAEPGRVWILLQSFGVMLWGLEISINNGAEKHQT